MKLNFKRRLSITHYCWLLCLASCLGACHRTSYTFQRSAATTYQALPLAPTVKSEETAAITLSRPRRISLPSKRRRLARPSAHYAATPSALARVKAPPRGKLASATTRVANRVRLQQEPTLDATPLHHRSRGIALLLAILSITYVPLSLHNFYLGYYGRGALAIALLVVGIYLLVIGFVGVLFGGAPAALGYVGLFMLAGWLGWQLSDLISIITGKLRPKAGEYNTRFL
jgi:hypothetical protein